MSFKDILLIGSLALNQGLKTRIKHWFKILIISVVILIISYLNFFVFPHQWNTHIKPFSEAEFDYMIDLSAPFGLAYYISDNITPMSYTNILLDKLGQNGFKVVDYVLATEYVLPTNIDLLILSDIGKLDITEYNNIIWGRYPRRDEVVISVSIPRRNISINDGMLVIDRKNVVSYSGVYMGGKADIVMEITLFNELFIDDYKPQDPFGSFSRSVILYIDLEGEPNKEVISNVVWQCVAELNSSKLIRFEQYVDRDDIFKIIDNSILSRGEILKNMESYFAAEYLNPLSTFTVSSVGALIIYIIYLVKVSIDVVKDDLDIIALLYSIGGSDLHIATYTLLTMAIFSIPPVIIAYLVSLYWIRIMYGLYLPYILIFQWLFPYIFTPLILVLLFSTIISLIYVRRVGLSYILSIEF